MVKNLSIKELEILVFNNKIIQSKLPKYKFLYDSYTMSLINPSMKNLGIRAIIEFANYANKNDLQIISEELGYEISLEKVYNSKVNYFEVSCDALELSLNLDEIYNEHIIYRNKDKVKVLQWR